MTAQTLTFLFMILVQLARIVLSAPAVDVLTLFLLGWMYSAHPPQRLSLLVRQTVHGRGLTGSAI